MHPRLALLLLAAAIAAGQTITNFAGNGTGGYSGDNGPATQAEVNRVVGLATDAAGNVYLADQNNNVIRKVSASGVITTFAGTTVAGYTGDGGAATQATLSGPTGVCVAPSGDVYVNDLSNRRVRKVAAASGIITTVAGTGTAVSSGDGGAATSAGLILPIRCVVDSSGNLFIVDQGAHVIRKVTTGGTITTYAGVNNSPGFSGDGGPATQAQMNNPTADTFDGAGNLYVTDQSNQRIRKIDTSGNITTVAGNGNIAFSGDAGLATLASLDYPGEIVFDSAGSLFIVDTVNEAIRKVTGGIISTVAGTPGTQGNSGDGGPPSQAQFGQPFAMTIDRAGNLYVADINYNRVRKISGVAAGNGPAITVTSAGVGVTNAASFQAGIAPGGIVTIFGTNLGASAGQTLIAPGSPWPPQLGSTSVTMNSITAPMYYVLNSSGTEQLSVQAPWSLSGVNSATVVVTTSAGSSAPQTVSVLGAQPGIFILDAASSGATHALTGAIATAANPAARGETVVLYMTGLGPVSNTPASGVAASLTVLSPTVIVPQVTIGGFVASVAFSGLTPGFIGLYQVNVQVPAAVASGLLDVSVQANGVTSNTAKLAVQ
jgi:uncharacterized protein (TIGR03437 family)